MKLTAIIEPAEDRKAIEDRLIACWQKRSVDEDPADVMDSVEVDLVGRNPLSVDELRRSLEFFPEGVYFSLAGGFGRSGDMLELLNELHMIISGEKLSGITCIYSRFYDVSVDKRIANKKHAGPLDMRFSEQFPGFGYYLHNGELELSIGQKGLHLKAWTSIADGEDFGVKVEHFVKAREYWKECELTKWPAKSGGVATVAKTRPQPLPPFCMVKNVIVETEEHLFEGSRGLTESFTFSSILEAQALWERFRGIVVRRYEESSLFADAVRFPGGAIRLHKLRARKEDVFGTAYEKIDIVLMSSSWKGAKFLAKRVFEHGRYLIRIRLAGKEDVCRTLLKEMEEELGVKITIESC